MGFYGRPRRRTRCLKGRRRWRGDSKRRRPHQGSQAERSGTGKEDILAVVEPVLMAPLRRKWNEVKEQAEELTGRRDVAGAGQRTRLNNELTRLVTGFASEIASVRVLDPACGSGNFLYVALKQLLDLEKEVITFAGDVGLPAFFPGVGPEQVHGIEVNEYAHELATATVSGLATSSG